ncbi:MAG: PrsW family glutamic-type intramembrane protease [Candidatus Paceibacterota bacterium]
MSFTTLVYALLAGLLPSLIWIWFWIREDANPEPRGLLTATFLGGTLAVIAAIFAEQYIANLHLNSSLQYTLWAGIEEIFKFIAVAVIALNADYNDEPIDAMVYCIVVALGFAALENTFFLLQPLTGGEIAQSIITGNMRFMGATLVHIVSSAVVGFGLGYVFYKGYVAKAIAIIVGLSAAITLHAAFNLSIINGTATETLKAFTWVWGAVVILMILFEEIKVVKPKLS